MIYIASDVSSQRYIARPGPAEHPFGRWLAYTYFCYRIKLQDDPHLQETTTRTGTSTLKTRCLSDPHQVDAIQIPIAHCPSKTTRTYPAVSSLEAYQTPAR